MPSGLHGTPARVRPASSLATVPSPRSLGTPPPAAAARLARPRHAAWPSRQPAGKNRPSKFHDRLSCGCVRLKTERTLARLGLFFLSFFLSLQPACGCLIPATRLVRCFAAATAPGVCGCTLLSATSLCTDQPLAVALFLMRDDATRNKERRGALGSSMADPQTFNSRLKGVLFWCCAHHPQQDDPAVLKRHALGCIGSLGQLRAAWL